MFVQGVYHQKSDHSDEGSEEEGTGDVLQVKNKTISCTPLAKIFVAIDIAIVSDYPMGFSQSFFMQTMDIYSTGIKETMATNQCNLQSKQEMIIDRPSNFPNCIHLYVRSWQF